MPVPGDADKTNMTRSIGVVFLFLLLSVALPAQQTADIPESAPAWILLERADLALEQRDLAEALQLYGEALADQPLLVEARLGMARVYRAQGDLTVAIRMYRQVLDQARQLQVPDDRYSVILELADLHHEQGRIRDEVRLLREITAEDPVFGQPSSTVQRDQMERLLRDVGINRVIVLFRLDFPQALEAHRRLARILLEEPERAGTTDGEAADAALAHALFAVVEIAGRGVEAIIRYDPYYRFESLEGFLRESASYRSVSTYLEDLAFDDALGLLRDAIRAHPDDAFRRHLDDIPDR